MKIHETSVTVVEFPLETWAESSSAVGKINDSAVTDQCHSGNISEVALKEKRIKLRAIKSDNLY